MLSPLRHRASLSRRLALRVVACLVAVAVVPTAWLAMSADDRPDGEDQALRPSQVRDIGPSTGSVGSERDVPMGVFRETKPEEVARFETWLGRPVQYVVDFSARATWYDISRPDYLLNAWHAAGDRRLVYAVPMLPSDEPASMAGGAAGEYDAHFRRLGARLVATGQEDAILRVGWEFNLESWPWSTPDEKAFIGYFRRIVTAMRSVPGQRFEIDWNVNNGGGNAYDALRYYPGDPYVDYVGVDVYDVSGRHYPYPEGCDAACLTTRQRLAWDSDIYGGDRGLSFWAAFAGQHGKRLSLPEWGLWKRPDARGGRDNPLFVRRMHEFIDNPHNNVGYHAYFEHDGDDGQHRLTRSFPVAGAEFRRLFGGPP